jgi:hypothetical protein
VGVATPACFQDLFALENLNIYPPFYCKPILIFVTMVGFMCIKNVGSVFVQSARLGHLIVELRPLTFTVFMESCVVIPAILLVW